MVDTQALKSGNLGSVIGLGKFGGTASSLGTVLVWILISIIIVTIIAGIIIWIFMRRSFNQEIWVFGRVGGVPMFKTKSKARYQRFGIAGDRLLQIRNLKKYVPPPTIQMGRNLWWYWERKDGELINIGLEDLDEKMENLKIHFVESDMRMQRLGIEKNLRDRLEKKGWWAEHGTAVMMIIFVIFITIALVVLFTKLKDVATALDTVAGSVNSMASQVEQFYKARVGGEAPSDLPAGGGSLVPALILILFKRRKRK